MITSIIGLYTFTIIILCCHLMSVVKCKSYPDSIIWWVSYDLHVASSFLLACWMTVPARMSANVTWSRQALTSTAGKKAPRIAALGGSQLCQGSAWHRRGIHWVPVTEELAEEKTAGSSTHPCARPLPICLQRLPHKSGTAQSPLQQRWQLLRRSSLSVLTEGCLL